MTGKVKRISPESIIIGSVWPDSIIALQPLDIIFQSEMMYKYFKIIELKKTLPIFLIRF
jgi:hypothetical protein